MARPHVFDAPDLRIRMSKAVLGRLQELASQDGVTVSDVVRSLILRAYDERKARPSQTKKGK